MLLTRHHATAFLDPSSSQFVEQLRRTWDPGMTRQIAAHLTLIYPEEVPDAAELAARTALAVARTPPFTIAVGSAIHAGSPADGVFLRVDDIDGGIRAFRATAVAAPDAIDFSPHVTIVHPRTSCRGDQAWAGLATTRIDARFPVTEVAITAFSGDHWPTLQVIPLTGRTSNDYAAGRTQPGSEEIPWQPRRAISFLAFLTLPGG
jgi:2'-5' RNA ligase